MRQFFYGRVSKDDDSMTTENQKFAFEQKGFKVDRFIDEQCSGVVEAMKRPKFKKLIEDQIEIGDELHILKLDRLGRDTIDVLSTIKLVTERGIKLFIYDLPVANLSSSEGKLMVSIFASFSQFEKDRLRERTLQGLARARSQGRVGGRPKGSKYTKQIKELLDIGLPKTIIAKKLGISRSTVYSVVETL